MPELITQVLLATEESGRLRVEEPTPVCENRSFLPGDQKQRADDLGADILLEATRDHALTLTKALMVIIKTPHIKAYLEQHDPKALEQATAAVYGEAL
jgi:hypothetical protein